MNGPKIAALRKQAGKTQTDLAIQAGISVMHLSAIERGVSHNPTLQTLQSLADALGVPVTELLTESARNGVA